MFQSRSKLKGFLKVQLCHTKPAGCSARIRCTCLRSETTAAVSHALPWLCFQQDFTNHLIQVRPLLEAL